MEHLLAKEGVAGSIPVSRFFFLPSESPINKGFAKFGIFKKSPRVFGVFVGQKVMITALILIMSVFAVISYKKVMSLCR